MKRNSLEYRTEGKANSSPQMVVSQKGATFFIKNLPGGNTVSYTDPPISERRWVNRSSLHWCEVQDIVLSSFIDWHFRHTIA